MSWRTTPVAVQIRRITRYLGINRLVMAIFGRGTYEESFQLLMLGAVRRGDVVWDIGANVGMYTTKFADIVGSEGKVYAYEPDPENLSRLRRSVADRSNTVVMPYALGDEVGTSMFKRGRDHLGATGRLLDTVDIESPEVVSVNVVSGDEVIRSGIAANPTVIKIDTEGFELEVLRGMTKLLSEKTTRVVCIEVHFSILSLRGLSTGAAEVERLLSSAGLRISWPDPSHIVAERPF